MMHLNMFTNTKNLTEGDFKFKYQPRKALDYEQLKIALHNIAPSSFEDKQGHFKRYTFCKHT